MEPVLKTTLLLIPGGRELSLPENTGRFKAAMQEALADRTAIIIMLADKPIVPEYVLHTMTDYKNVLLIESDSIITESDVWHEVHTILAPDYLPTIATSGFDYQLIQMQSVSVRYEDFEILEKYM